MRTVDTGNLVYTFNILQQKASQCYSIKLICGYMLNSGEVSICPLYQKLSAHMTCGCVQGTAGTTTALELLISASRQRSRYDQILLCQSLMLLDYNPPYSRPISLCVACLGRVKSFMDTSPTLNDRLNRL